MSERMVVAIPSEQGGLDGVRSGHFGHAAEFTLVEVVDGTIAGVSVMENPPHSHGGCGSIVQLLSSAGATHSIVAGIGGGPLSGMRSAGIEVYHDPDNATPRAAVEALLRGTLAGMDDRTACSGHHH